MSVSASDDFIKNLTSEEKVSLVHGRGQWHTRSVKGLPSVMMTDGPHGLRKQSDVNAGINDSAEATCFPTASAVASGWDASNARKMAECMADEAVAEDVSVILGPGVNIKRSPLCGRNFEYYSEDPCLAGKMAAEFIKGVQSRGVGCSLKHFALNGRESYRMTTDTLVDERALREIYLSAFEYAVKNAQPYTVMAAYNKVNGASCTENKRLLTDILRGEWGFDGAVISDWGATYDAVKAVEAGCDLEMPDNLGYHEKQLLSAVKNGLLPEACLDRAAANVAELVRKVSLPKNKKAVDYALHDKAARDIENDCAVLLKNNGNILPLSRGESYLIVGELAEKPRFQGAGSSHINTGPVKNFVDIMRGRQVECLYCRGYSVLGDKVDADMQNSAVEAAKKFDKILFFGGLTDEFEGEGYDRSKLEIPSCQQVLLDKLYAVNKNIIFVAFGGSPFAAPWIENVSALLHMHLGGQAVHESVFDLLFGEVSPSGRLAETYPLTLASAPSFCYFNDKKRSVELRESIFAGYRYYDTFGVEVAFPFGFGLSYTSFRYSSLKVVKKEKGFELEVTVENVGEREGREVVQIYVGNPSTGIMRPKKELRAFGKTENLAAGQRQTMTFTLDERAFSVYDTEEKRFTAINGAYTVYVGGNVSKEVLSTEVQVDFGKNDRNNDREKYPSYFTRPELVFTVPDEEFYALSSLTAVNETETEKGGFTMMSTLGEMSERSRLIRAVVRANVKKAAKNSPTGREDDPVAQMTAHGAKETPLISLYTMAGVPMKYIRFLLHYANGRIGKALKSLFGAADD